jgi:hypothetical protein
MRKLTIALICCAGITGIVAIAQHCWGWEKTHCCPATCLCPCTKGGRCDCHAVE